MLTRLCLSRNSTTALFIVHTVDVFTPDFCSHRQQHVFHLCFTLWHTTATILGKKCLSARLRGHGAMPISPAFYCLQLVHVERERAHLAIFFLAQFQFTPPIPPGSYTEKNDGLWTAQIRFTKKGHTYAITGPNVSRLKGHHQM